MGAVSIDIYRKEREYEHLTLSDENVVKYLILHRSKVDVLYGANNNININQAGDAFEFNQELIVLYASLDELIKKANLKDKELEFLKWIFEGFTIPDIVEVHKYARRTAYNTLDRIVLKMVECNKQDWFEVMETKGYIEGKN